MTTREDSTERDEKQRRGGDDLATPQPQPREVAVTVDREQKKVKAGTYIVAEFKKLVGVDASRVLDEVINGEFKELDDAQKITIKGGEVFVSHVRHGGSS